MPLTTGSIPRRLLTALVALTLLAAACGGSGDEESAPAADSAADSGASTDTEDAPSEEAADGDDEPAASLFASTATEAPFATDGGATSATDGVTVVDGDPRGDLPEQVAQVTGEWPTDWSRQTIDLGTLQLGIPTNDPRDRIPPIDAPQFEPIAAATWLDDREPGALVELDGEVRFYPLSILTRHEIVNDRFGDVPVIVTYCPLCNTAISFDGRVDGQKLRFGVSGLLRNSDMVMWDDETVTLWQQLTGEAVVGELAGTRLELISTSIVSYGDARAAFPEALSLARTTGFSIDYGANPYVGYSTSDTPFLFDGELDPRFPALSRVVGISVDQVHKAYPFVQISAVGAINDDVDGVPVAVFWGGDTADALDQQTIADSTAIGTAVAFDRRVDGQTLTFTPAGDDTFVDAETSTTWTLLGQAVDGPLAGQRLSSVLHRNEFWFAWAAFFPEAAVYGG
ncbi:MAG: DUF3179 domain-containing protein [Actinomycetota bacterium]